MPILSIFIAMLYLTEAGYYGHVLSKNLPIDLDNRLYTIIHVIGGMNFDEIITFARHASPEEIQHLYEKVLEFPSAMESLLPYAGEFRLLQNSDEYKEIKDIINFRKTEDNLLQEQTQPQWDPTFNEIIPPTLKEKLFNYWTRNGKPDWEALKLFGVDTGNISDSAFDDVLDIVYPVLKIEWEGGVDKTSFGLKKDEWRHAITNGIYDIRFKVIPTSYTYTWDSVDGEGYGGEEGYACWNLTFLIDKESWWDEYSIPEIFPNKTTEDVMNSMEDHQAEIIEELWEWIATEAQHYFHQYCKVTVKIV